ncbi:MAG: TPM domain-containing protein [Bacteroidales bacterium]|nr:TPM domain-containing protein [Bacteroidales bacterium]MCF8391028.1 TPM domain-containing protein [Bacteroidales bacterium]
MSADKFFNPLEKADIRTAIHEAELNTSGEIRVHIENEVKGDVLDRASYIFEKLRIHNTKERNGILFYLAVDSKKFAILGDAGINAKVSPSFWDTIKERMAEYFRKEKFTEGLTEGIILTGEQLKKYFPYLKDDKNELSDEISFGTN